MPVEIRLEKKPFGLIPLTAADEEELATFADNSHLKAVITRSKSRPMLRLYWATVEIVAKGIGLDKTALSNQLLCHTRRFEGISIPNQYDSVFILRRISKMDWRELRDYVSAAFAVLFEVYANPESKPEIMRVAERRAQTTYDRALRDLEQEERQ